MLWRDVRRRFPWLDGVGTDRADGEVKPFVAPVAEVDAAEEDDELVRVEVMVVNRLVGIGNGSVEAAGDSSFAL